MKFIFELRGYIKSQPKKRENNNNGGGGSRDNKMKTRKKKTATGGSSNPHAAKGGERLKWPTDSNPTLRLCVVSSPLTYTHTHTHTHTRYLLAEPRSPANESNGLVGFGNSKPHSPDAFSGNKTSPMDNKWEKVKGNFLLHNSKEELSESSSLLIRVY